MPSLRETYAQKDTEPFGTYVMYNQMAQLYSQNTIRSNRINFESFWNSNSDTGSLYVITTKNLFATSEDQHSMLSFVESGNSIFLGTENLDSTLEAELGCAISDSNGLDWDIFAMRNTAVKLDAPIAKATGSFNFFYFPFDNRFSKIDAVSSRILGRNESGKPNYIVCFYGKGRFYIHCEPRALSNYFLLQDNNYQYLQQLFSLTSAAPERVFWDDFYCKQQRTRSSGKGREQKGIATLLQYPAMAWAFWLLLLLLLLYVLFGGKRRQRIVPVIPPNKNTSLAFTETIGRLYLQQKDNRNIADKIITYFLEFIRNQYYLNTNHLNEEFMVNLSRKSDVPLENIQQLFRQIRQFQEAASLSDEQLLSLNNQIENFYKNKT